MKNLSCITASILLFCNLDITASHRKEKSIPNYVSPDANNYIQGHFIYEKCRKAYFRNCYPNASTKPIYCKKSESIQSKIQEEYQRALALSPKRAADYTEILKTTGFLKFAQTIVPTPTRSLAISISSQIDDETNSVRSTNSRFSDQASFSPSQSPIQLNDITTQENHLKQEIVLQSIKKFLDQYQSNNDGLYHLFPKSN